MAEIKISELEAKQKQLVEMAEALMREPDGMKVAEMAPAVQKVGEELAELAAAFEQQQHAKYGINKRGMTEVVLTEHQRARVKRETGITLDSIRIPDEGGLTARMMEGTHPHFIEMKALEYARQQKIEAESNEIARVNLENQLEYLASLSPQHAEQVQKLRDDPNFAGGLLKKK